jgi:hypothetical protein
MLIFGAVYLLSPSGQSLTSDAAISEHRDHVLQHMRNQERGCGSQWFGPAATVDLAQTLGVIRAAGTKTQIADTIYDVTTPCDSPTRATSVKGPTCNTTHHYQT